MSEEVMDGDLFDFDPEQIKAFHDAEVRGGKGDVPDGKYTATIIKAFGQVKNGNPQLNVHLKINNGKYKGRMLFKSYNLKHPVGLSSLKGDLIICGLPLKDLSELRDKVPELVNLNLSVAKKKNDKDFVNIYFNDLLAAEENGSEGDVEDNF